jgi:DNA-binding NarL/FixJ family response regulator
MIRVGLVDDEALIRAGVKAVLDADPDIEVVAEASDGIEAIDLARVHRPDVVLLDIRMPRMDGITALSRLQTLEPAPAVIILTTFSEDEYIAEALREGASGFLTKAGDPREMLVGVRAVAAGGAYLSPQVARRVITGFGGTPPGVQLAQMTAAKARIAELTDREREVLRLIGSGLSNAEIGRRLSVVEGTVKAHVSTVFTRLGMRNRVQAAVLAYQAGLLDST